MKHILIVGKLKPDLSGVLVLFLYTPKIYVFMAFGKTILRPKFKKVTERMGTYFPTTVRTGRYLKINKYEKQRLKFKKSIHQNVYF